MNKSLFLLPLLAAGLALTGCGGDPNNPDDPGKEDSNTLVLDFTSESPMDFPYVDDIETLNVVSYEGIDYNTMGCYDDGYQGVGNLNFALKKIAGDDKVQSGENMPFFANATAYDKAIKSVEIIVSSATGGIDFYVDFPESAPQKITAGSEKGTKNSATASKEATYKVENKNGGKYFSICASKAVGQWRKNGKLATIKIHF